MWRAGIERPVIRPIIIGALIVASPLLAGVAAWQALLVVAILVVGLAVLEHRSVGA
jgi:hypothetical protein